MLLFGTYKSEYLPNKKCYHMAERYLMENVFIFHVYAHDRHLKLKKPWRIVRKKSWFIFVTSLKLEHNFVAEFLWCKISWIWVGSFSLAKHENGVTFFRSDKDESHHNNPLQLVIKTLFKGKFFRQYFYE